MPLPTEIQTGNQDRTTLLNLLQSLEVPPNYRVVLDADPDTERLRVTVYKSNPWAIKFWGVMAFRFHPEERAQRQIQGRSYRSVLLQLDENPEFLEFEISIQGSVSYATAI